MQTSIKRMGNSAAVLLPKPVLAHLRVGAGDTLEMDLQEGRVILSPARRNPREGWAEAARALAASGEAAVAWPELDVDFDPDWTW